ncbi:MAG: hypothetical protein ACJAU9_000368 [Lentimonas sp.]|jgi:hypothetical protein
MTRIAQFEEQIHQTLHIQPVQSRGWAHPKYKAFRLAGVYSALAKV